MIHPWGVVRLQVLPQGRASGGLGTRVLGVCVGGWRAAERQGVGVLDSVLAAFMNAFGAGPVLEISQNYFGRQQI